MSGRFVRASKFRHVHGEQAKKEFCYLGAKVSSTGEGNFVKGTVNYVAYVGVGGGGPVTVLRRTDYGRLDTSPFTVNLHKNPALDLDFNPFDEHMIAISSDDGLIKIGVFSDDLIKPKSSVDKAVAVLEGHGKKTHLLHYHPTAANILGSASFDNSVRIWDVEKQTQLYQIDFPDLPQCFEWNTDGSLISVMCKDRAISFYDPRAGSNAVSSFSPFSGQKAGRVAFADHKSKFIAAGSSNQSVRQYVVVDPRKIEKAETFDIDQSNGTLILNYDQDLGVLFMAGKGDGAIKYYELVDDANPLYFLSEFRSSESQKTASFLPKRACDTKLNEIAIALRVTTDGVIPISFQVPRKSDQFQEDIFPDTYAGIPALTAEEYVAGQNKQPPTVSMKPGSSQEQQPAVSFKPVKSYAVLEKELAAALDRIKELEADVAKLKTGN